MTGGCFSASPQVNDQNNVQFAHRALLFIVVNMLFINESSFVPVRRRARSLVSVDLLYLSLLSRRG